MAIKCDPFGLYVLYVIWSFISLHKLSITSIFMHNPVSYRHHEQMLNTLMNKLSTEEFSRGNMVINTSTT